MWGLRVALPSWVMTHTVKRSLLAKSARGSQPFLLRHATGPPGKAAEAHVPNSPKSQSGRPFSQLTSSGGWKETAPCGQPAGGRERTKRFQAARVSVLNASLCLLLSGNVGVL